MFLDATFGGFLAVLSLVLGVLVLTGHGGFIMKNNKNANGQNVYDPEKMSKASGLMLIGFGVLTGIDCFTKTAWAKILYIVLMVALFVGYVLYIRKKCMK